MQSFEAKTQYLRDNVPQNWREDFSEYFMNLKENQIIDINDYTLADIINIVNKFKHIKANQQKQKSVKVSFNDFQTVDLVRAFSIISALQNSQNPQPNTHKKKSALDILDEVCDTKSNSNKKIVSLIQIEYQHDNLPSMPYAYKNQKIPYKNQHIYFKDFKDSIKCFEAPYRSNQFVNQNVEAKIIGHQIIENSIFHNYAMYSMHFNPMNLVCQRNYQDFVKLRIVLEKFYPGVQLPYLEKQSWFNTDLINIQNQKIKILYFFNDILKSREFRNSRVLQDFISLKQHKAMKRKFEEYEAIKPLKGIEQLCVIGGNIKVNISQSQRIYHERLDKLLNQFEDLLKQKNKVVELLGKQLSQVSQTMRKLSLISAQLAQQTKKFNMRVDNFQIPVEGSFKVFNSIFSYWADKIQSDRKIVTNQLAPLFNYELNNLSTLKTLLETNKQFEKSHLKKLGYEQDDSIESYYKKDLDCWKNGILIESKNPIVLKYQLGYLSNRVCTQSFKFFKVMNEHLINEIVKIAEISKPILVKDQQFYQHLSLIIFS